MNQRAKLPTEALELLGLTQKDLDVYEALLRLGSAPLRRVAEEANLNRGTAYDALKRLLDVGLAQYVDAKKHRYFTAQDPHKLRGLATRREVAIREARLAIDAAVPQFEDMQGRGERRPAVRYYEGATGVRDILEDVLKATERAESKGYRVYSSAAIRDLIGAAWPAFTQERIKRGVRVQAIAIGEGGGTFGLDARKWLTTTAIAPTYTFLYEGKTAFISADAKQRLFGAIIEDPALAATQKVIFDVLWSRLP